MNRQVIGVLVLALAAVGILVTSPWLNPDVVDGRALVQPPAPPPAVGTCLARLPSTDLPGNTMTSPAAAAGSPVSCDGEHAGEVFHVHDPALPAFAPPSASRPLCSEPGGDIWSYMGVPVDDGTGGWQPVLDVSIVVVEPDRRQSEAGQRWQACVIAGGGSRPTLTGSVRATGDGAGPPAQLSLCETAVSADFTRQSSGACDSAHGTEVFGVRVPVPGDTVSALDTSCRSLVVRDTGRASLPDEPGLRVSAEIYQFVDDSVRRVDVLPSDGDGWARCVAEAREGRFLTGSLRRLGTDPIPWAP